MANDTLHPILRATYGVTSYTVAYRRSFAGLFFFFFSYLIRMF